MINLNNQHVSLNARLNNGYYTETWDHYVWIKGDANDPQNHLYAYVCTFVNRYRRLADGTPVRNHIQWVDDQAPIINLSRYPMISQEEQTSVMNYHSTIMQNEDQFQSFTDPLVYVRSHQMANVNQMANVFQLGSTLTSTESFRLFG